MGILDTLALLKEKAHEELFKEVIPKACATCGDRISLSILQLGIVKKIFGLDKTNPLAVATLLEKVWFLDLLEQIATTKNLEFRARDLDVDPLEVYLAYPLELKQKLDLPIDVSQMRFLTLSCLVKTDFASAYESVIKQKKEKKPFLDYLICHQTWIETLEKVETLKMEEIKAEKTFALDQEEEPDWMAADNLYKKSRGAHNHYFG